MLKFFTAVVMTLTLIDAWQPRVYRKGQIRIRWSNDQFLLDIGRKPNPPWPRPIQQNNKYVCTIFRKFKYNEQY